MDNDCITVTEFYDIVRNRRAWGETKLIKKICISGSSFGQHIQVSLYLEYRKRTVAFTPYLLLG